MIKLYIFDSVDDVRAFEGNVPPVTEPAPEVPIPNELDEPVVNEFPKKKKGTRRSSKPAKAEDEDGQRKARKCGKCGKVGHTSRKCADGKRCFACQSEDHNTVNCPDLEDTITELRNGGKDSLQIAAQLHITLGLVNKFCNSDES